MEQRTPKVLVVGTTSDYIDWLRRASPKRCLFLTAPEVRRQALESAPEKGEELVADLSRPDEALRLLLEYLEKHSLQIEGVACFDCESLEVASSVAQAMGLSYPSASAVRNCRDKDRCKSLWAKAGLVTPRTQRIRSAREGVDFFQIIDGKVVLKPIMGTGSELVFSAATPREVEWRYRLIERGLARRQDDRRQARQSRRGDIVIEEYIDAPEYSCDFSIDGDRIEVIRLARKILSRDGLLGTAMGYLVPGRLPDCVGQASLEEILRLSARALGIERAICMVDFWVRDGEPVLSELAPRPGGDCIPPLLRLVYGLDIISTCVEFAAGSAHAVLSTGAVSGDTGAPKPPALISMPLRSPVGGRVAAMDTTGLKADPRVRETALKRQVGHRVLMPPRDYDSWVLGHVIFSPLPDRDVAGQCDELLALFKVEMEKTKEETLKTYTDRIGPLLRQPPPALPREELLAYIQPFLQERDRYLAPLADHEPPLYLLDYRALNHRADELKEAFTAALPWVGFFYAMKSNNHPLVTGALVARGFGIDVSSGEELAQGLKHEAAEILFSGPGKREAELRLAAAHSDRVTVLLDSFTELDRLERVAAEARSPLRAGIRLTSNPEGLWRKFGIPPDSLERFWRKTLSCQWVRLCGLQFHTSWNLDPRAQVSFIESLGRLLEGCPAELRQAIEFMDIGGGYWPAQGELLQYAGTPLGAVEKALGMAGACHDAHHRLPAAPIQVFAEEIGRAVQGAFSQLPRCRILLEPGRWLCHDAMHLLMTVIDRKAPDLVITDLGTNAIGWERFESDYFPLLNLSRPAATERPCLVLGSLCTPHDVWGYGYFGEELDIGDVILIPSQGAYTYSLRQHFIKPLPPVIALS